MTKSEAQAGLKIVQFTAENIKKLKALALAAGAVFGAGAVMTLFWSVHIIAWAAGWE